MRKELEELVVPGAAPAACQGLSLLHPAATLPVNRHGVPVRDTANEGYHLIFGQMHAALVKAQLVAAPESIRETGAIGRRLNCMNRPLAQA